MGILLSVTKDLYPSSPRLPQPLLPGFRWHPSRIPYLPLLLLLYITPLYMSIPRGLIISYVDDFSMTVASPSYRGNIRHLEKLFSTIAAKGRDIGMSFSVPKSELIHWRTPSQGTPPSAAPIELEGHLFHPSKVVWWLGYWFTPALTSAHHFRHRVSLAQAIFSFVKRLSSPGAGVRPFLCHRIANGLLLPILTYGADLLTPNSTALSCMNSFSHRVKRGTTNNFLSIPTSILSREACLPPIISYCRYRRRLAALRIACAPLNPKPAAARLPQSFPSLSAFRAQDSVYLPLDWQMKIPSPPIRKHLPVDALTHLILPLQASDASLSFCTPPPQPGTNIPPPDLMRKTYQALRARTRNMLLQGWGINAPTPHYYGYPPLPLPVPLHGSSEIRGRVNSPDASSEELPSGPPLLVRREPKPILPPLQS